METFLMLLIGVSVFTALVTEAIKKIMDEAGKVYKSNILGYDKVMQAITQIKVGKSKE